MRASAAGLRVSSRGLDTVIVAAGIRHGNAGAGGVVDREYPRARLRETGTTPAAPAGLRDERHVRRKREATRKAKLYMAGAWTGAEHRHGPLRPGPCVPRQARVRHRAWAGRDDACEVVRVARELERCPERPTRKSARGRRRTAAGLEEDEKTRHHRAQGDHGTHPVSIRGAQRDACGSGPHHVSTMIDGYPVTRCYVPDDAGVDDARPRARPSEVRGTRTPSRTCRRTTNAGTAPQRTRTGSRRTRSPRQDATRQQRVHPRSTWALADGWSHARAREAGRINGRAHLRRTRTARKEGRSTVRGKVTRAGRPLHVRCTTAK